MTSNSVTDHENEDNCADDGGLLAGVVFLSVFDGLCLIVLAIILLVFCRRRRHLMDLNSRRTSQRHNYEPPAITATPRSAVPLPPVPGHKPLVGVPSGTESYLSPTELADYPPIRSGQGTTAEGRPSAAENEGSASAVGAEVYENHAFSGDTTQRQTIYANTPDSTQNEFVELY